MRVALTGGRQAARGKDSLGRRRTPDPGKHLENVPWKGVETHGRQGETTEGHGIP